MQSKFSSPVKGLLPLFLIINIAVTALAIVAFAFYSQNTQPAPAAKQKVSITQLVQQLDLPMVDALTMYGQGKVRQLLELTSVLDDEFEYTLYRFNATSETQLVYSSTKPAIESKKVNEHLTEQGVLHHILLLNDQPIGELIIKQQLPAPPLTQQDSQVIAYIIAIVSVFALFALALLFNTYINTRLRKSSHLLNEELQAITENGNYDSKVSEKLDLGLSGVAKNINLLLDKVNSVMSEKEAAQKELQKLQTGLESEVQQRTIALELSLIHI